MKRIVLLLVLITLTVAAVAVRIETTSGITHKGEFVKKTGDMYFIKTTMGNVTVFEEEITAAYSDAGIDITESFIAMDPTQELAQDIQPSPYLIKNLNQLSTPLWVFTIASIGYYVYVISKME
jgi:hypothetical protein